MKYIFTILFSSVFLVRGQSETHNFITYDTSFSSAFGNGEAFNAIITRPTNLFTEGNADTASRPLIIMMPGQGQMGSNNFSLLTQYGPHYWMNNGWDGSVQLGNGTHYPIIISIGAVTNTIPNPAQYYPIIQYIIAHYHIKPGCVYGTGLSEGAFTHGGMIEYEQTIGDHAGMKLFNALACFEGTPTTPYSAFPNTVTPYPNSQWADTPYFGTWATVYHGKFFYLEGSGSDNFRDGWHYSVEMNSAVPNSAYFSYEDIGGGAHCCWNTMYDPSQTNWTSVGTLGPNNSPSQAGTNTMGDYTGGNVYQWMLRQGDTSLVVPASGGGSGHTCTVYYWDSTQTNIAINRTNYPTLQACDSVKIRPKFGGYRSRYLQKINAGAVPNPKDPTTYVTVYWMPQDNTYAYPAYITPSAASEQANGVDSIYGVHEVGMRMNDHVDPENFNFAGTGYVQYYWVDKDTCISCSGWIPQGLSLSLPAFTGGADSVHCFYMDSISNSYFDSVGTPGTFDGITTLWIGNLPTAKNQTWVKLGICNNFFGDNPSTHNPACFIHLMGAFDVTIKNNVFKNLGGGTGTYVGHAAQIFCRACSFDVSDNHFELGFGNPVRNVGAGWIPGWPTRLRRSTFHNNIDSFPIKYPFIETQRDTVGDSVYIPGYVPTASPPIYNNTFAHPAMGVGHQYYNCSTVDAYAVAGTTDTLQVYNNLQYGPTDTLATVCTSQGCNAFMTFPNGAISYLDSLGNIWGQTLYFPQTGLADSVHFYPAINGRLYNNGVSNSTVVSGVDPYGTTYPVSGRASVGRATGIDIGAVMLPFSPAYIGPIPSGSRILTH